MNDEHDELLALRARVAELERERDADYHLAMRQGELLTGVANALKGKPRRLHSHSHADLPEVAASAAASLEALRQAVGPVALWWAMVEAQSELAGKPIPDDAPVLHFMGSGASTIVTAGELRALCQANSPAPAVPESGAP
jgi:hypothetical protein